MQIIYQTGQIKEVINMKKFDKYICIFCVVAGFIATYIIGYNIGNGKENNIVLNEELISEKPYVSNGIVTGQETEANVKEKNQYLKNTSSLVVESLMEGYEENITSTEEKLPIEMIGLNREGVIKYIKNNSERFQNDGEEIINIMLVSFNENKVVVRKNVREKEVVIYPDGDSERYNYYIGFKDNNIVVFKKDKKTVFIETGLTYDMIERQTREKIEKGVWIENISALYKYLESITS